MHEKIPIIYLYIIQDCRMGLFLRQLSGVGVITAIGADSEEWDSTVRVSGLGAVLLVRTQAH